MFKSCFNCIQLLLSEGLLLSGHDRSDGGIITTILEMAFAGNCGIDINFNNNNDNNNNVESQLKLLFSEELGFIFEVLPHNLNKVLEAFTTTTIPAYIIGTVTKEKTINIKINQEVFILRSFIIIIIIVFCHYFCCFYFSVLLPLLFFCCYYCF